MSKRSVKSVGRKSSASTSGKSPGGKKPEKCEVCSKPHKSLRLLPCGHAFCPTCLKTIIKPPSEEDGRSTKMSQKGGKKSAPKEEYVCSTCNPPAPPEPSPEDFEHGECAPCKFEEKASPASGYCVECGELLCETCCTEHNKFKTIRAHNILRGDKIPKDTGAIARLPLLMMCMVHTEKDLEYYCADHDVMGCSACVNIDHRRCERVMFIKDITDEAADRKVVADAAVELRDIRKNFEDIHRDTGEILESLEKQRNEIRERRDVYRNKIMALLDSMDSSSELEMEQIIQKVSKDMGEDSESSKEILAQIDSSIQVLDAAAGHATDQQMFVAGRRSIADRDKHMNLLNNTMGSIQNVKLDFKPDPTLERLIKSLELFEGRCITSNRTRHNQKQKMTFQPRNGFVDVNEMTQTSQFGSRVDLERPDSGYSGRFSRFQSPRSDGLPSLAANSRMTGSVPDFRSVGLRRPSSEFQSHNGRMSMPQTPSHHNNPDALHQPRSMPPTPRRLDIGRSSFIRPGATTSFMPNMNEDNALPMIHNRVAQSEPGFPVNRQQSFKRDFAPMSPRTVGNNSLVNQGLNQGLSVSQADILAVSRPLPQRRGSVTSMFSGKQSQSESMFSAKQSETISIPGRQVSTKTSRSDILAEASPIKRRGELSGTTPYRERKAVLAGQFNIRLQEDKSPCSLKGAVIMQDGRIAMADYDNHNVKIFDSKMYRGAQLKLSSGPWDIAVTGPKELAVTLPFESKIQFVSVTEQLKATRSIKMDMDCYGLVCRNQELLVVCNDYLIGPAVQVLSLTGRVKQTIDTDRDGRRILSDPYYLTVTPTGKLIYVSDKDQIVCMDRHGNVTSVYKEQSLKNARGIDLDSEGNLYVCGYMSNNVHQITMHGIDFRCLIENDQVWDPWSVTFNESNGTIMVTCESSDTVKVFSLQ